MKKLLLIIPLLTGCTREYECCILRPLGEQECNNELTTGIFPYTVPNYIVGWTKDEERAEEMCANEYNTGLKNAIKDSVGTIGVIRRYNCECEKAN